MVLALRLPARWFGDYARLVVMRRAVPEVELDNVETKSELLVERLKGTAAMDVHFDFDYNNKRYSSLLEIKSHVGPLPTSDNILLFEGHQAKLLEGAGLPPVSWRVRQVAFEVFGGYFQLATVTLELHSEN